MGQKGNPKGKNIYYTVRDSLDLTRKEAAEKLGFITEDRLFKIETGASPVSPEEVLVMSEVYGHPELCNMYCTKECPIGRKYVPQADITSISQITLEMLASLNQLEKEKNRLIEITVDGKIADDEKKDFESISEQLDRIAAAIQAMKLWVQKEMNC